LVLFQTVAAWADDDDKGVLTRYLEDTLSGYGRDVVIDGFRGALSSKATIEQLSIADEHGVWLIIKGATLDWDRAAVLSGEININELSAEYIEVRRIPSASQSGPSAQASEFSLPELPVSIAIASIAARDVALAEGIVGPAVNLSVQGSLGLSDGAGRVALAILRKGSVAGAFELAAGYTNDTRELSIDLSLIEDAGGIIATLLNIPEAPSVALGLKGVAPIDAFTADVVLATDGQERLRGRVQTSSDRTAEMAAGTRNFSVDIAGDISPVLLPDQRSFFGDHLALKSDLSLHPDGRLSLEQLLLTTVSMTLKGSLDLSPDHIPERFDLFAEMGLDNGQALVLPFSGAATKVRGAQLHGRFDAEQGSEWTLDGLIAGIEHQGSTIGSLTLVGAGEIDPQGVARISGDVASIAQGMDLSDPAMAQAVGPSATVHTAFHWEDGQPLSLTAIGVETEGFALDGTAQISGLSSDGMIAGQARLTRGDLTKLQALAGRPIGGQLQAEIAGSYTLLTGAFDLDLQGAGNDLEVGIPKIDRIISGPSSLSMLARRDLDGTSLRRFELKASGAEILASGRLSNTAAVLDFDSKLADISTLVDGVSGPARIEGQARKMDGDWQFELSGEGPKQAQVTASVSLPSQGEAAVTFDADIGDIGWISPDLVGGMSLRGNANLRENGWVLDAIAEQGNDSRLSVSGRMSSDFTTADIEATGTIPLALANRQIAPNSVKGNAELALRLQGPLTLEVLSGGIQTTDAHLSLPTLRNSLTDVALTAELAGGRARIKSTANVASGGRLSASGSLGLQTPQTADLTVLVDQARVTDNQLYSTVASGALALTGSTTNALTLSGDLTLEALDIRIPTSNLVAAGDLWDIEHRNASVESLRTLTKAGLDGPQDAAKNYAAAPFNLDLRLSAENRIFVRGRGLDAELGGALRLGGTTSAVIPQGQFDLIRGRLDILGKRVDLEEGTARLQGQFVPTLRMVGSSQTEDITVRIILEGPALSPELTLQSAPSYPQDEILAQFLFGRELANISALQTVQLASAVATLAGLGGDSVLERARRTAGVDDLDVTSNGDGNTSVSVGKYLNDNIYSDVEVDSNGRSVINLNLDLMPSTVLRGTVTSEGSSNIGLFFERDY
jgi:translocation and assembly module TamB